MRDARPPADSDIAAHFENEFTTLSEDDRDFDDPALLEYFFFTRTGIDPKIYEEIPGDPYRTSLPEDSYRPDGSFLKRKLVLDAGCGPGRFTPVAAEHAGFVVGLDLGGHVARAAARTKHLDNVAFVQGSILTPPFKPHVFDYVFSIGVLHHTGDAEKACRRLGELVSETGSVSIWVYPRSYWGGGIRGPFNRVVHRLLARMKPDRALKVCSRVLYPLGRIQGWAARRLLSRIAAAPLFLVSIPRHPRREVMIATIYDYFCPPTISVHDATELESWMKASGFDQVTQLPIPAAVFARRT